MIFEDFDGNDKVKDRLSRAFAQGRIPHAIILEGPPGSGKRTLAGILAKAAVCAAAGERPCGVCAGCIKAKAGSHPDIAAVGGGAAARSIHVEAIRRIRSDAYIRPNEAEHKVYCLFSAETMSEQAQNALLKVLEEPPAGVLFILTCVSASALLATIRSRASIFTLEPPRGEAADQKAAALAAEIVRNITAPGEMELLISTAPLVRDKDLFRSVLDCLSLLMRDACVLRAGGTAAAGEPAVEGLAAALTRDRLLSLNGLCAETRRRLEQNANSALLVTAFCADLRAAAGR